MKLTKRSYLYIILLIIDAFCMALDFVGNFDTFYDWIFGEAGGFTRYGSPDDSLCLILVWIVLITLLGTVIFQLISKKDFMKLCSCINFIALTVLFIFGFMEKGSNGAMGGGMPLMWIISITYLIFSLTAKKEQ